METIEDAFEDGRETEWKESGSLMVMELPIEPRTIWGGKKFLIPLNKITFILKTLEVIRISSPVPSSPLNIPLWHRIILKWKGLRKSRHKKTSLPSLCLPKIRVNISLVKLMPSRSRTGRTIFITRDGDSIKMWLHKWTSLNNLYFLLVSPIYLLSQIYCL